MGNITLTETDFERLCIQSVWVRTPGAEPAPEGRWPAEDDDGEAFYQEHWEYAYFFDADASFVLGRIFLESQQAAYQVIWDERTDGWVIFTNYAALSWQRR